METQISLDILYHEIQEQILAIDVKLEAYGDEAIFERLRLYEARLELQRIFSRLKNKQSDHAGVA